MEPLEHPNSMHLTAAQGWLELGNAQEALDELKLIPTSLHDRADILEVRWQAVVQLKDWKQGLAIAEVLCRENPDLSHGWIHRSYCLHELKRTQEAWDSLLPAVDKFPREWLIYYNLACYACQLGRLDQSQAWLTRALQFGNPREINDLAAKDPDLKPLRERAKG